MEVIQKQDGMHTIEVLKISHRFKDYPFIVCSGKSIVQLPMSVGKRSYGLKTLKQLYHVRQNIYLINSKRVSTKKLRELSYKVKEEFILNYKKDCPF
jgi:hypothetical protein